jgi:hypothetical protein
MMGEGKGGGRGGDGERRGRKEKKPSGTQQTIDVGERAKEGLEGSHKYAYAIEHCDDRSHLW